MVEQGWNKVVFGWFRFILSGRVATFSHFMENAIILDASNDCAKAEEIGFIDTFASLLLLFLSPLTLLMFLR